MKKIGFENVEIELNIQNLRDYFSGIGTNSGYTLTKRQKFNRWVKEFDIILEQIGKIDADVLLKLKVDLGYSFAHRNLILTALFQPSAKKIFSEIKKEFNLLSDFIVTFENLDSLEKCSDRAKSLAWIGDAAIKFAISSRIWRIDISTEDLNDTRKKYESNENFSLLCDKWQLFESRINRDPEDKKSKSAIKSKGTLVEAVYGVIFIERGIEGVQDALHLIDKSLEKIPKNLRYDEIILEEFS
jgi:dsRNA-specific ribonuclease